MALAGIDGHLHNEAILVTINQYLLDFLKVPAFLAFTPELLPSPAEVYGVAGLNGQIERFTIHISDHQDLAGLGVLRYDRY